MLKSFASFFLRLLGWKTDPQLPEFKKYVLIGAPHTSNWDFMYTMIGLTSMGIKFNWVAKHTLFFWPLGVVFRMIGGIPVNRKSGTSFLKKSIDLYREREEFIMAIAPEGTRGKTEFWKTGFYTVAKKAKVPVVMGYIDYQNKQLGVSGVLHPSGDLEQDMHILADFYKDKRGKYPEKQAPVRVKPKKKI